MAKEKFERSKPHVNIGTIGHIDHGKTTLTGGDYQGVVEAQPEGAVPRVLTRLTMRRKSASAVITIAVSHVEYETPNRPLRRTWTARVMRTTSRT